jgi:hypothetical protein
MRAMAWHLDVRRRRGVVRGPAGCRRTRGRRRP